MITEDIPPDLETAKPIDFPELSYGNSETVSMTRENLNVLSFSLCSFYVLGLRVSNAN